MLQWEKTPLLTCPSWPKTLVVPDGSDRNLNPLGFFADHRPVTGLMNSRPEEPDGLVIAEGSVAGPNQRKSNDTVAPIETGSWKRRRALGPLKKSLTRRCLAIIRALPSFTSALTPSSRSASVQNKPLG